MSKHSKQPSADKNHKETEEVPFTECGETAGSTAPKEEPLKASIYQEMDLLRQQSGEYKDKYLRSLAELDNARKRLQKEKQDLMRYAIEQVVCDLLHPIDNLENALKFANMGSEELKNWAAGFQMILTQFKDVLTSNGVLTFDSEGTSFDPSLHEAVETEENSQLEEGTILKEFIKGYKLGDKTIRPARVKVAKAPRTPQEPNQNQ